jgi:oligoendopeptidase F
MTLAHELGHGVHGLLAGREQGVLMAQAPIAYAETASVFGETTTFHFLKERLAKKNEAKSLLALLMGKIDDTINTTVRQISFSEFERRIHGFDPARGRWEQPKKLSVGETNDLWLVATKQLYGEEGEVFTYENAEHLWSYISHFHSPFYVYGYALGELLTQSLYAQRPRLGDQFEPLYLDLLRAGSTRDVVDLLKPFGLDPRGEDFWTAGIRVGLGAMVDEAEQLARTPGITPA